MGGSRDLHNWCMGGADKGQLNHRVDYNVGHRDYHLAYYCGVQLGGRGQG